jgi:hypothetical protein
MPIHELGRPIGPIPFETANYDSLLMKVMTRGGIIPNEIGELDRISLGKSLMVATNENLFEMRL